jgi:hypothetical protein
MKTLIAIAALAATAISSIAQEATVFDHSIPNPRTRAEVRAETEAAVQEGRRISQGNYTREVAPAPASSQRTRAEVRAEVIAAMAAGERLSYGEARRDPLRSRQPLAASTKIATRP